MLWALAALLAHLLCLAPWTVMMRRVDPYMDEVFHIPQAQRYCDGNFTDWDPKITTFPGLYLSSSLARGFSGVFCSKDVLRLENLFYGLGTHIVMYRLLRRRCSDARKAAAHSFMLSVYPIHFFFQTLYYTDVGALFWTLLTHELVMPMPSKALPSRRIMLAGMAGCVAVLFRQTNAVWLMFTFGTAVLHDLQQSHKWGPALTQSAISPTVLMIFCKALLMESQRLLLRFGVLLVPVLMFVGFVVHNGSIVVGDHSNHQVAAHWAQLAYLSAVTAATSGVGLGSAVSLGSLKDFASDCFGSCRSVLLLLASLGLAAYLLHFYSLEHPFLLADNRHYTFYIWKRFLSRPWFKEALAPGYVYAAWYFCRRNSVHGGLWVLIWWVAAVLTLVPAPLLEPRYWTTAVLIAHVHSPEYTWLSLFATSSVFLLMNVLTLGIFVHRPFWWPGGEVARFMW